MAGDTSPATYYRTTSTQHYTEYTQYSAGQPFPRELLRSSPTSAIQSKRGIDTKRRDGRLQNAT